MRLIATAILIFNVGVVFGQNLAGYVGSNYSGTNALYINPASGVDSRYKVYINLVGVDAFVATNTIKYAAPFNLLHLGNKARTRQGKEIWNKNYLLFNDAKLAGNLHSLLDIRGPAIQYRLNSKESFAITTRGRGILNLTKVNPKFIGFLRDGISTINIGDDIQNQKANFNLDTYAEVAFNYAKNISFEPEHALHVGVSVKRLIGLGNTHVRINNADFRKELNTVNNRPYFAVNTIDLEYGYSNIDRGVEDFSFRPGYWLGRPNPGRALAADIGLVYEFRPEIRKYYRRQNGKVEEDPTRNKYTLKLGASITDIGRIKYDNAGYETSNVEGTFDNIALGTEWPLFPNNRVSRNLNNSLANSGYTAVSEPEFKSHLPTTLNVFGDYHVRDNFYIYALWSQNLRLGNRVGMEKPTALSIVPRYETKWIDLAASLSLLNEYRNIAVGISARFGPLFVGTDHLIGLLNIGSPQGSNLYAGLSIPIFNRHKTESITDCPDYGFEPTKQNKKRLFGRKN